MRKDLLVFIIISVLLSAKSFGQELMARFITHPESLSTELELSANPQNFETRSNLNQKINQELERLQLRGYIGVKAWEQEITSDEGTIILSVIFDLGPQWQEIIFSYPISIHPYINSVGGHQTKRQVQQEHNNSKDEVNPREPETKDSLNYYKVSVQELPDFLNRLSQAITRDFSPFSLLKLTEIEALEYPIVRAKLIADLYPKRKIDSLVIKGYTNVDQGLLKHFAGLKFPLTFSQETIMKAEDQLASSAYLTIPRPSETLFEQEKTTLYMYLEKKVANQIEGILGFGTDPARRALTLNGFINIQLWNNLNKSEQFDLRYKADGNQQERLEIQASYPYIANSPFGIKGTFDLFRRDSTFTTLHSRGQITYKPFGPLALGIGYTTLQSTIGSNLDLNQNNISDFKQGLWGFEAQLEQRRNSSLMPRRYFVNAQMEFGTSQENTSIENNFSENKQSNPRQRFNLDLDYLFDLWPNHFFWLYHKTVVIRGDNLRVNELHRFGGTQSLRGFNENLIETSQLHLIQAEYRLSFSEAFYLHHLSDFAFYQNSVDELYTQNYSLGLGIAAITRAGILKIQIAQGFGKRTDFSTNNTKIHLVFKSRF